MSVEVFTPESGSRLQAAFNYLVNHDLKALSYVALHVTGEATVTGLSNAVAEQTDNDEVRSYVKAYPITWRKAGFASVRVDKGLTRSHANYYTATDTEIALATIGTTTEWAEENKRSLTATFSDVGSKSESKGPFNTVQIIDGLLTGANIGEIDLPGYKPNVYGGVSSHSTRLKGMVAEGLVVATEAVQEFKIQDPTYRGTVPFSNLSLATRQAYQIMSFAKELAPDQEWTVTSLVDKAVAFQLTNASDAAKLKLALTRAVSVYSPRSFPGAVKKIDLDRRRYSISPDFAEAGQDLVNRLRVVDTASPRKLSALAAIAIESYKDASRASTIAEMGIMNSKHGARRHQLATG